MSVRAIEPQFTVVCDWCGAEPEFDSITLYYSASRVEEGARTNSYRSLDGKHMCPTCSEERGVVPEIGLDGMMLSSIDKEPGA